jgi:leucine dehydrogenase
MEIFDELERAGHEQVAFCSDPSAGYRAIIAIHSTRLGPAVGGTRMWRYASERDALTDALRLSRGMTYKNALAGLPLGGGKAIILEPDEPANRDGLLRAHGRFVDRFGGRYVTAEDVGTSPADMAVIRTETRFVAGLVDGGGDPSPYTARGVFRGMQAAARFRWGSDELAGRTVALQGCGNVGSNLARQLARAGARLVVADVDAERATRLAAEIGAASVGADEIAAVEADVFSPCALGAVLDDRTIGKLRVELVVGAANNQLLEPRHGDALAARGVLYAPDYVVNAGGVISGGRDLLGWSAEEVARRVEAIFDTTLEVFEFARAEGVAPATAADRLADTRLAAGSA